MVYFGDFQRKFLGLKTMEQERFGEDKEHGFKETSCFCLKNSTSDLMFHVNVCLCLEGLGVIKRVQKIARKCQIPPQSQGEAETLKNVSVTFLGWKFRPETFRQCR